VCLAVVVLALRRGGAWLGLAWRRHSPGVCRRAAMAVLLTASPVSFIFPFPFFLYSASLLSCG
jgi:hypothetical protein